MSDAAIRVSEAAFLIAGDRVADMLDFLLPGSGDDFRDMCRSLIPGAHQAVMYQVAGAATELDYYGSN